jgi:hypothetical protein
VKDFNYNDLMRTCDLLEYPLRERPDSISIIGVRSAVVFANQFDDYVCMVVHTSNEHKLYKFKATTDPGSFYLKSPLNEKGTAVLVPGYYKETHALDLHNGKYKAICQRLGPVVVYRDNDKDEEAEETIVRETGFFGINIHRAHRFSIMDKVDKFSAGCQVIQSPEDFTFLIGCAERHANTWGNKFSYILLDEDQIVYV